MRIGRRHWRGRRLPGLEDGSILTLGFVATRFRMPLPMAELFPDEDYRFHLTLRKGDMAEFFTQPDPAALDERRLWLDRDFARYGAATSAAGPLLDELAAWADGSVGRIAPSRRAPEGGWLGALGRALVPDFMLLTRDGQVSAFRPRWSAFPRRGSRRRR